MRLLTSYYKQSSKIFLDYWILVVYITDPYTVLRFVKVHKPYPLAIVTLIIFFNKSSQCKQMVRGPSTLSKTNLFIGTNVMIFNKVFYP